MIFDSDLRAALSRPPRPGIRREAYDEIFLSQHPLRRPCSSTASASCMALRGSSTRLELIAAAAAIMPAGRRATGRQPVARCRVALVPVFAGLAFPHRRPCRFHFYAPDVYQGTSQRQRRLAGRVSQDRRLRGPSASWPHMRRAWNRSAGRSLDPGRADNDRRQLAGPMAG